MDVVDWDLHAVVRGCTAAAIVTTTKNTISRSGGDSSGGGGATSSSSMADLHSPTRFPNHESSEAKNDTNTEDLHQLYRSFFPKPSLSNSINFSKDEQQQQPQQQFKKQQKPRRRKNQSKRVCVIPAEGVSTDVWAWRKYGQKPIKGSPYPRGYYRCSTSKGCLARKQVDRNKSDPGMFIVTYTGEHNHPAPTYRNSLAGSTRQKTQTVTVAEHADGLSPTTSVDEEVVVLQGAKAESGEVLGGGDDDLGMSDTAVSDDFFEGLEGLADAVTGDRFSDHFPASIDLPLGC